MLDLLIVWAFTALVAVFIAWQILWPQKPKLRQQVRQTTPHANQRDSSKQKIEATLSDDEEEATQAWEEDADRFKLFDSFSRARRIVPPSPAVVDEQHRFRDKSRALFTSLRAHMDSLKEGEENNAKFVKQEEGEKLVNEIKELFCTDLPSRFSGSRAAECTAMSLCCTVVVQEDALNLLQGCGEHYPALKPLCQQVIETVVPNIWSM
eukprot:Blabericola_migrator_1__783@NODE_1196_length_5141_cov_394_266062_g811_i0_p3_GENE_NODE_1196_length_5141_cov_394_266062_g811_i0NODE_1196_length_5141_cov_394_266062_g811_i0_p3_ORF_typecomplete_len208_score46_45RskA/PF10099_9/0_017SLAIN/PF15301_6/0_022TssO/PF17561_2/1_3e02TssO/PF17561_2/3_NODE_1196_length_5141_cov_394_266062_g811_i017482371